MARVRFWTQLLLLVLILRQSDVVSDQSGELQEEISRLEADITKKTEQYEQPFGECKQQQTLSSEAAFSSRKLAEDELKSKLQQTEGIISSLKKQLEANEEALKNNNEKQNQLHATIDGLIKTLEKLNLTEEELFGQRKMATPMLYGMFGLLLLALILILRQSAKKEELKSNCETQKRAIQELRGKQKELQATIDGQSKTEEANKGTIQELRERQKQLQATIDVQSKTEETNKRAIQELHEKQKQLQATIDGQRKTEEANNRTVQDLHEKQKQLQATIDGQTKTEEANNRTVQELREKQKQLQASIDEQTKTLEPLVCRYLFEAVKSGDVNSVKILFKFANDTCTTDDEHRHTPLTLATLKGHVGVVRVLLEGGAKTESTDANENTALHCAAYNGLLEICCLLLDLGAKVDSLNKWKNTSMYYAAEKGHLSVVKLLVERGADVRLKNGNGQTASEKARKEKKEDVAKWLDSVSRI